jgi:nucleoside-diphosphate-sugar epimerase
MKIEQSSATAPRCYLVTGAAGFIASKVCELLLRDGHTVVGVDNLNDYYDVRLKDYRLSRLLGSASAEAMADKAGSWEPGVDPKKSVFAGVGRVLQNAPGSTTEERRVKDNAPYQKPDERLFAAENSGVGRIIPNPPGSGKQSGALGTQPRGEDGLAKPWPEADGHGRPVGDARSTTRPTFEFHHLDIENLPALEALFSAHRFDAVFNLAARAGVRYSLEFPELYRRTNVLGEENVLKCQVKYGVKKHVLASSSSVYAGCPMPFVEDAVLGKMQSPYAETKRQAELLALEYHQKHGIDVTALRYFTVFGPAGRPDMAPLRFIKWIDEGTPITLYGDGSQARDFTYVDDIARGTILAAKPLGYEVINLGGGRNPISLMTVIAFIEKALGKKAKISGHPPSAADMKETWADITKAQRLLGWSPQITTEVGFCKAVDWHAANRVWLKVIKL